MNNSNAGTAGGIFAAMGLMVILVMLFLWLLVIIGMWKVFTKGGQPGWGSIIPIYNIYCLVTIAGKPAWWLILFFIPIVSFVAWILVSLDVAKNFGKSGGFAVGLMFLPFIFYPMLGFGSASYQPGSASPATA